jgi:8-oxo-dGTP diphosphatase
MQKSPLPVVITALLDHNRILLIKRARGDYAGLWGLPGGKVKKAEHLSDAATREICEESGITAAFKGLLGTVSELLMENGIVVQHFVLHVCELVPESVDVTRNGEGELAWIELDEIEGMKEEIIPSDYLMIEKMVRKKESNYYNCVLSKSGGTYVLERFE